jgi:hypothetical protein
MVVLFRLWTKVKIFLVFVKLELPESRRFSASKSYENDFERCFKIYYNKLTVIYNKLIIL